MNKRVPQSPQKKRGFRFNAQGLASPRTILTISAR
jgi:hypothetical protein